MLEIKHSRKSSIGFFLFSLLMSVAPIGFLVQEGIGIGGALLGPLGMILDLAVILIFIAMVFFFGKQLVSNKAAITMDTNEIKWHVPIKKLTLQWKEIEKIELGYQKNPFGGQVLGNMKYLVITPFNEETVKKHYRGKEQSQEFLLVPFSWDMKKSIGILVDDLTLKPEEILVHAKKFLTEYSNERIGNTK